MNHGSPTTNASQDSGEPDVDIEGGPGSLELVFMYRGLLPVPDVQGQAGPVWLASWRTYSMGAGVAFLLQTCFIMALLLLHLLPIAKEQVPSQRGRCRRSRRRRRQCMPSLLLGVHACLLPYGLLTGVALLAPCTLSLHQPHPALTALLVRVARNLDFLARVCLIAGYAFLLHIILKVTRVRVGPKRLQNAKLMTAAFVTEGALYVGMDILISELPHLRCLILLPQCVYAITCLLLCFIFIYKGFRIAQFMLDTNTMFYEIVAYEKLKRELVEGGHPRDLALCRLRRLTWKARDREQSVLEGVSLRTDTVGASHSSDSDTWYVDDQVGENSGLTHHGRNHHPNRRHHHAFHSDTRDLTSNHTWPSMDHVNLTTSNYCDSRPPNSLSKRLPQGLNTSHKDYCIRAFIDNYSDFGFTSSDYGCMTETPTTGMMSLDDQYWDQLQRPPASPLIQEPPQSAASNHTDPATVSGEVDKLSINLQPARCNGSNFRLDCLPPSSRETDGTCVEDEDEGVSHAPCNKPQSSREEDRGYMADSELSSPSQTPRQTPRSARPPPRGPGLPVPVDSPQHSLYHVQCDPPRCQWLGLRRIRQGRLLSRILKLTYFSTLFLFIGTVLRLYAMFGVYGVLATQAKVSPWPWLVFQSCDKVCELVVGGTLAHSLYRLGRHGARRTHTTRRTSNKSSLTSTLTDTACKRQDEGHSKEGLAANEEANTVC